MIIILSTKESPAFLKFVEEFNKAPSISKALIRGSIYLEHSMVKVDDLWVIRQKSILDQYLKFGIFLGISLALLGVLLQSSLILTIGAITLTSSAALISPMIWFLAYSLRLFIIGHRFKVSLANNTLLIEKLLYEREHVTK